MLGVRWHSGITELVYSMVMGPSPSVVCNGAEGGSCNAYIQSSLKIVKKLIICHKNVLPGCTTQHPCQSLLMRDNSSCFVQETVFLTVRGSLPSVD